METKPAEDSADSIWLLPALKDTLHSLDAAGLRCLADAEMRKTVAHERAAAFVLRELEFALSLFGGNRPSTVLLKEHALTFAMSARARAERITERTALPRPARGEIARKLQELDELLRAVEIRG